jgi:hypothetical protein
MKLTTGLFLLLPLLFSCSMGAPFERKPLEFIMQDGFVLKCPQPPSDVVAKGGKVSAEIVAEKLGVALKGVVGADLNVERIRQELPTDLITFREVESIICVQYGNRIRTKEEYRAFTDRIAPAYNINRPIETVSNPDTMKPNSLVETCGPSFSTKRLAKDFVPHWASKIETLRTGRNIQYHDLENLFEVYGRGLVSMNGVNIFEELDFTLDCLERIGYLKVEKYDPPRTLSGRVVENRKIIFSDPSRPVPH